MRNEAPDGKIGDERMTWAGKVGGMVQDHITRKHAWPTEHREGRNGRPHLRWLDCINRDIKKMEMEEEDWKAPARYNERRGRSGEGDVVEDTQLIIP